MNSMQLDTVRDCLLQLLADIRPNAVALVDAFDFPDALLCSVLGRYDGRVYENLYNWAAKAPLNKTSVSADTTNTLCSSVCCPDARILCCSVCLHAAVLTKLIICSFLYDSTVCLKKNIPDIFSCNFRKHCRIFIMFGTHVTEKVSNQ